MLSICQLCLHFYFHTACRLDSCDILHIHAYRPLKTEIISRGTAGSSPENWAQQAAPGAGLCTAEDKEVWLFLQ